MGEASRAAWAAAVASSPMTASLRPMKATLLALARLMRSDGTLDRPRDELVERTGVEQRTLGRHLQLAVELGWLVRTRRGQKHVTAVYRATLPNASHPAIRGLLSGGLSKPPGYLLRTGLSKQPCGLHQEETETPVEGVAVDDGHDRRNEPPSSRAGTTEQGGRPGGRPRQDVPGPSSLAAFRVGRSTGRGPAAEVSRSQGFDVLRPGSQATTRVAGSRGNHLSGRLHGGPDERTNTA